MPHFDFETCSAHAYSTMSMPTTNRFSKRLCWYSKQMYVKHCIIIWQVSIIV